MGQQQASMRPRQQGTGNGAKFGCAHTPLGNGTVLAAAMPSAGACVRCPTIPTKSPGGRSTDTLTSHPLIRSSQSFGLGE